MQSLLPVAGKNIRRKPLRTGILVFSIALLTMALVFAISFVRRVNSSIQRSGDRLGADILVVPSNARDAAQEILLENRTKTFYMERGLVDRVRSIEGVDRVTEQVYLVTLGSLCCSVPEAMVIAFNQETDFIVRPWLAKKIGRPLRIGEAVAGFESAYNIQLGLVEVDSSLFGNVFRIVGTLDKTATGLDNALFISMDNMQNIVKSGAVGVKSGDISVIFVKVKAGADPAVIAKRIENNFIEVDVMSRKDIGKNILATLRDMSRIFTLTIALSSAMAFFLVWAIFTAIANERAKEVGIMRALGAKESHILRIFLLEAIVIGCIGAVLGIIAGAGASSALAGSFSIVQQLSTTLSAAEQSLIAAVSFAGGTLICVLGALGPIRRLKKLEPLMVIKTE